MMRSIWRMAQWKHSTNSSCRVRSQGGYLGSFWSDIDSPEDVTCIMARLPRCYVPKWQRDFKDKPEYNTFRKMHDRMRLWSVNHEVDWLEKPHTHKFGSDGGSKPSTSDRSMRRLWSDQGFDDDDYGLTDTRGRKGHQKSEHRGSKPAHTPSSSSQKGSQKKFKPNSSLRCLVCKDRVGTQGPHSTSTCGRIARTKRMAELADASCEVVQAEAFRWMKYRVCLLILEILMAWLMFLWFS